MSAKEVSQRVEAMSDEEAQRLGAEIATGRGSVRHAVGNQMIEIRDVLILRLLLELDRSNARITELERTSPKAAS